ncbi:Tubulin binding cofactor A [Pseudocohnilembus persalinus]|uniref:Tubulin-specific chaperone A n=1 Tax=Pseudocohnilembus persalinus TaxID=266149 RepID=A0A0V0QL29_PSEPJ|nr:Tubulin binding cofactor A [Pseudocohnilembus persalinus]|eukprot:KRX02942.1 Tubulin binding cofactor A [Pseudocohnilembus persalinus]
MSDQVAQQQPVPQQLPNLYPPENPTQKQLRIKSGSLKRTLKEYKSYQIEEQQMLQKIDQWKSEGMEEHQMKKKIELLEETQSMLPNCKQRLQDIFMEVQAWMNENGDSPDIQDMEEKTKCEETLQEVDDFLEQLNQQVGQDDEDEEENEEEEEQENQN